MAMQAKEGLASLLGSLRPKPSHGPAMLRHWLGAAGGKGGLGEKVVLVF